MHRATLKATHKATCKVMRKAMRKVAQVVAEAGETMVLQIAMVMVLLWHAMVFRQAPVVLRNGLDLLLRRPVRDGHCAILSTMRTRHIGNNKGHPKHPDIQMNCRDARGDNLN